MPDSDPAAINPIFETWASLVELGRHSRGDVKAAAKYFEAAYEESRKFPTLEYRRALSAYYLAYVRVQEDREDNAIELFCEALPLMEAKGDEQKRCSDVHSLLGSFFFRKKELEKAKSHIISSTDLQTRASTENLQLLSSIFLTQDLYVDAEPLLCELIERLESENAPELEITLESLRWVYNKTGNAPGELRVKKRLLKLKEDGEFVLQNRHVQDPNRPPGWGADKITHFIETAIGNQFATFHTDRADYQKLLELDDRFWTARRNFRIRMVDIVSEKNDVLPFEEIEFSAEEWIEMYFFLRAHASLLGAIRLITSGQIPESHMLLRGCLENALYAHYVKNEDERKRTWLNRNTSPEAALACRKAFMNVKVESCLSDADSALGIKAKKLYDETIDSGAHPNVQVFLRDTFQKNTDGQINLMVAYLNPDRISETIEFAVDVGRCTLSIFAPIFPGLID